MAIDIQMDILIFNLNGLAWARSKNTGLVRNKLTRQQVNESSTSTPYDSRCIPIQVPLLLHRAFSATIFSKSLIRNALSCFKVIIDQICWVDLIALCPFHVLPNMCTLAV